jgi:alpha-L-rhamnosidase
MIQVHDIHIEYGDVHIGIGAAEPRLSWVASAPEGVQQLGYEIEARRGGVTQTTNRVDSAESVWVPWPFSPLVSREGTELRVRLYDENGAGPWSETVYIEAGLLKRSDWEAKWVVIDDTATKQPGPAFLARCEFEVPATAFDPRLYITGHGIYLAELNGHRIGGEELAPGWTSYRHRLVYRAHDLTGLLRPGTNVLGVWIADGWYRGKLGFNGGARHPYGEDLAILAQVEAKISGQHRCLIGADARWLRHRSAISSVGLYEGEHYDQMTEITGWSLPGLDTSGWEQVGTGVVFPGELVPATFPPVKVTQTLRPLTVEHVGNERLRWDFGQNIAGRLRVELEAKDKTTVTLRHAEAIEDGQLATRPLRRAASVDVVETGGPVKLEYSPRFTFHGFRYAEGVADFSQVEISDVTAEVLHSDMRRVGWFECSDPMLNKLHENVVWSMRGNFVSLPTDCPQRDERLGWTGDIETFVPTARFLYDCSGLLVNWLSDLAAEQKDMGTVPNFVPWVECGFSNDPTAAWGDAAVIVPWVLYERTGDAAILATQFDSMKAWVDQVYELTGRTGLWNSGFQLGDWLDPEAPPEAPDRARTDRYLVATGYHSYSARLLARVSEVLGRHSEAIRYRGISESAAIAFRNEWVSPSGRLVSDTPTALALAITFGLLETPAQYEVATNRLAELVREGDYRIKTGFVGTPLVCDALAAGGHMDDAYHLLLQTECPSWLYPVTMGATTVWERWDSMLPDGSVNPGEMTSFNHYALGAVADFLHRKVGGLAPLEPGYRAVEIAPIPGGGVNWAKTKHLTPFGSCAVSWEREGEDFSVDVTLPAGVRAEIVLPGSGERIAAVGPDRVTLHDRIRPADADPERPKLHNLHDPIEKAVTH